MSDECVVCGASNFELVAGASVCLECGEHEANYHELTEDIEDFWEMDKTIFFTQIKHEENVTNQQNSDDSSSFDWCTFEAYNIILKNWAEALIHLGASNKFKNALFQLWVRYLQKNKIAFLKHEKSENQESQTVDAKEIKFFRKRDFVNLKGGKLIKNKSVHKESKEDTLIKDIKKKIHTKKWRDSHCRENSAKMSRLIAKKMSETLDSTNYFNEMDKSQITSSDDGEYDMANFERQPLMESVEDGGAGDGASWVTPNHENADKDKEGTSDQDANASQLQIENNLYYYHEQKETKKSRHWILSYSPYHLTLPKLLAVVYLALLIADEDILLLDLIRWCREGHFPYQSAGYLVPKEKQFEGRDVDLFNQPIPSAATLRTHSAYIAYFLSIQALPLPCEEIIINKMAAALNIPDELKVLVTEIVKNLRTENYVACSVPPVESFVAAAVLLAFKVYFGLDDEHEEILSDWAEKINVILKTHNKELRLFSWREWHRYINKVDWWTKETVVSGLAINGSDELCSSSVNAKLFLQYFWSQGMWFAPVFSDSNTKTDKVTWNCLLLNHTLGLNMTTLEEVLKQNKFAHYSQPRVGAIIQYVLKGSSMDYLPSIEKNMLKIATELLATNFTNCSFNWLLHNHEIVFEFEKLGKKINIVKVPLNDPAKAYQRLKKAENRSKENPKPMIFLIPDPLKSYWLPDNDNKIENLPRSFTWLLKILSRLCETMEMDILRQFRNLEKKYRSRYKIDDKMKT